MSTRDFFFPAVQIAGVDKEPITLEIAYMTDAERVIIRRRLRLVSVAYQPEKLNSLDPIVAEEALEFMERAIVELAEHLAPFYRLVEGSLDLRDSPDDDFNTRRANCANVIRTLGEIADQILVVNVQHRSASQTKH